MKKIVKAGGRCMSLEALAEENPAGTKVILLG
jgi:ribosomal protein L18E